MNENLHHIRLLAGLETRPDGRPDRMLDRHHAERLAAHLGADLQRVVPSVDRAMLVVGAVVFEPFELIRPGFRAWQALESLAQATLRERGFEPQVVAIGAHRSRLPDPALQPPDQPVQGQFVALPMSLICPASAAQALRKSLEEALFERGSINPPARAVLSAAAGLETVHGQLLTLADLIALQRVQLDGAGLGGFWPVVEQVLTDEGNEHDFDLPAGLQARWNPHARRVELAFVSFNQHDGQADDYALWLRAFRMLTALLDSHGVDWRAVPGAALTLDANNDSMIEAAGTSDLADSLTVQHHPDIGLLAFTVVEDGRLRHIYPLRPESTARIQRELGTRGLERIDTGPRLHTDPTTGHLRPART